MPQENEALVAELERLRQVYVQRLPARLDAVRVAWRALPGSGWPVAGLHALARDLHGLAGTGASFGFSGLSERALGCEAMVLRALEGPLPPAPDLVEQIRRRLGELRASPHDGAPEAFPLVGLGEPSPAGVPQARRRLVLVDPEPVRAAALAHQLEQYGYDALTFADVGGLGRTVATAPPDALIIDLPLVGGAHALAQALSEVRRHRGPVPLVVTSSRGDLETRLWAARNGAGAWLEQPVDVGVLVERLDALCGRVPERPLRVLLVDAGLADDDARVRALQGRGIRVVAEAEPRRLLTRLAETPPDLLAMGQGRPGCGAGELCAVLGMDPSWKQLPVVRLAGPGETLDAPPDGAEPVRVLFQDDAERLARQLEMLARAGRSRRDEGRLDPVTGLASRAHFDARVQVEVARAQRYGRPLTLAVLDLDHSRALVAQHGADAAERVLRVLGRLMRDRLRTSDVIGRLGGDEVGVLLTETPADRGVPVMDGLRQALRQLTLKGEGNQDMVATVSVGVAGLQSWHDPRALVAAASQALEHAKDLGRDRVQEAQVGTPGPGTGQSTPNL